MRRRTFLAGIGAGAGAVALGACGAPRIAAIADEPAERAFPSIGRLIDVDGLQVHATDQGRSGPPVILIHGANVNLRDWTHSISSRLSTRNRAIAMDRPGFGYSERRGDGWTPSRQAAQLRAAAARMGAEKPIVVGHSWGAMVALAWALDAPAEVTGVVSVSGVTMPWGPAADIAAALGVNKLGVEYYAASLSRRAEEGAIDDFVSRAFRPQNPPPGYLDYVGAPLSLRASTIAANNEDLVQIQSALNELSPRYPDLIVPVEIVHGDRDWLLDIDQHAHDLAKFLPNARVTVAEGVGHMAHHARPDLLERAVQRLSGLA